MSKFDFRPVTEQQKKKMIKIKITSSHSVGKEGNIEHLIDKEFDVTWVDEAGFYIKYGIEGDGYLIKFSECEVLICEPICAEEEERWNVLRL